MKYEQLERRTLMNQGSTFLCLHIVKRPTTYVFANAYSKKALYEHLYFCKGWLVRVFESYVVFLVAT